MLEFGNSTYPKARKNYKCSLCGQEINKGEIYHRWCGKYDGDMFDNKLHMTCQNIISEYCSAVNENEYSEDEICEWLHDEYCLCCECYENDDCTEHPLSCPLIREHFMEQKNNEKEKRM